jgi:flagellar biosynthetic protein FliP
VVCRALGLSVLGAGLVFGLSRLRRRVRRRASAVRPSRVGRVARGTLRFVLHFGEMVVAMYVGMYALGALNAQVLVPFAHLDLTGPTPETQALAMGVFMGLPMAVWMWIRGYGTRHAVEMAAAMIGPFALAVALHVVGLVPQAAMMGVGSDLMWLAMVGVMLPHWRHYAGGAHAHCTPAAAPAALAATH